MKIKIKVSIKNNEKEIENNYNAIYIEERKIIKYQELDKTNVTLNLKDNILVRENQEIYMQYIFRNNEITNNDILIKDMNKKLNISLKTLSLINKEEIFEVKYNLVDNNDLFIYKVVLEEKI